MKNLFLVAALFVGAVSANPAPVVVNAEPCLVSRVTGAISGVVGGAANMVLDNKKTIVAAVILGAIVYYVATQYDADAENN